VTGRNFGVRDGDVQSVVFGEEASVGAAVRWISSTRLGVTVPAGAGQRLQLVVRRRDGIQSTGGQFSYAVPAITGADPPFLLPGVGAATVTLIGQNLGRRSNDIAGIRIGGYECVQVQFRSSS